MNHIFLYGPPGSGKSTVGRILAKNLNLDFVDLDHEIEAHINTSITQFITEWGEPAFRNVETETLKRLVRTSPRVIALGGGALLRAQNRVMAENKGAVICFETEPQVLLQRILSDSNQRPLLAGKLEETLPALLQRRAAHYHSFDMRIPTDAFTPDQTAQAIQLLLGRYHLQGMSHSYDVLLQPGGFDGLTDLFKSYQFGGPIALVTDENIVPLYAERVITLLRRAGYKIHLITLPPGEATKNLDTVTALWRRFLDAGLDRKSTVLALGGGVITDIAGFAASTFMRGVSWVAVPTSLLGMVDAGLGGKTGIDLVEGKNLAGTFYPPKLVLINPYMLVTLPDEELRSGLAEVIKHGVIADPELFSMCSAGMNAVKATLPEIVRRAMAVKIQVIEADPYEKDLRAMLNFGHTVGHAIEKVSNYKIRHGEAVAMGMVAETKLAEKLWLCSKGLSDQIANVLISVGLPYQIPDNLPRADLIRAMRVDKKRVGDAIRFALPSEIGNMEINVEVENLNQIFE